MSRTFQFFANRWDGRQGMAYLTGGEHDHLRRVLRLGPGDRILVSSGGGDLYHAVIEETGGEETRVRILTPVAWRSESPLTVTLVQSLPKRKKMEWILQKAVELGVARVVPIISTRSIPRLTEVRQRRREDRWREILRASAKQAYRGIVPELEEITPFEEALKALDGKRCFLCDPGEGVPLRSCLEGMGVVSEVTVIVGPEGGFSPEEIALARSKGIVICSLGPRILRLETAVIKVLSVLQYTLGDG